METQYIGKYEIVSMLGKGAMGIVYKAQDPEIGRYVAIKTLKSVFLGDGGEEALKRFRQESRSAGRLVHPSIVTIFEAGRDEDGTPYIVMEYVDGVGVDAMLTKKGSLDPLAVLHYLSQVCSAIDYAHLNKVIHRDIKPSNIIVDDEDRPFIVDFGVAKLSDTSLTPAGTVVGIPSYMSPEQIRGMSIDGRTDIFSLGVVAFEMFTGVRPFAGKDFTTVVSNIIHKEPLTFEELGVSLPAGIEEAVGRCLSKEKDDRFSHAFEFVEALAKVLDVQVDGGGIIGGLVKEPGPGETIIKAMDFVELKPVESAVSSEVDDDNEVDEAPEKEETPEIEEPSLVDDLSAQQSTGVFSRPWYYSLGVVVGCIFITYGIWTGFDSWLEEDTDKPAIEKLAGPDERAAIAQAPVTDSSVINGRIDADFLLNTPVNELNDEQLLALLDNPSIGLDKIREALREAASREKEVFVGPLLYMLDDSRFLVRVDLVKSMSVPFYLNREDVFNKFVKLLGDEDKLVRGFSVKALGLSGNERVKDIFRNAQQREQSEVVLKVIEQELNKLRSINED